MATQETRTAKAKATVDTSAPRAFAHMYFNRKGILNREERQAVVDRDNGMLLDRLAAIKNTHGGRHSYLHPSPTMPGSLNILGRQQNMLRVSHENQAIAKRLGATTSSYNRHEYEGDFQVAVGHKKHIAKYPVLSKSVKEHSDGIPVASVSEVKMEKLTMMRSNSVKLCK